MTLLTLATYCIGIHFSNISQDTLIAYYESVSLTNYTISKYYVIKTDNLIIEVTQVPELIIPVRIPAIEFRMTYDLRAKEVTTYVIGRESQMVSFTRRNIFDNSITRYAIEEEAIGNSRIFSLYIDSTFSSRMTLSGSIPNFHPSSLYYPEINALPEKIQMSGSVKTFRAMITDVDEKRRLLNSLQVDFENYEVLNEQELKRLPQTMFGMTFEEFTEWIKKFAEKNNWH